MLDAGQVRVMEVALRRKINAIMQLKHNDVVLIAGKGTRITRLSARSVLDYSDRVTAARLLGVIA